MRPAVAAFALTLLVACSEAQAPAPGRVHHWVLMTLKDPAEVPALLEDCDEALPRIPGVAAVHAGRPLDIGRPEVSSDFHVGLHLVFATVDGYKGYLDHPDHKRILAKWQPRVAAIRIHDVEDATP